MKRSILAVLALLAAGLARGQSLDEVVDRGIAALGGSARLAQVRSERMTGTIQFPPEAPSPLTVEFKRPGKIRTEIEFQKGKFEQIFDGRKGWMLNPFKGTAVLPMTVEERRNTPEQADIDGPLVDWKKRGLKLSLEGKKRLLEADVWRIRVTYPTGNVRTLDLDAASYLKVRWEGELGEGAHKADNESFFTDYRPIDGIAFPFKIQSGIVGKGTNQIILFEKIEVDSKIDDKRFKRP